MPSMPHAADSIRTPTADPHMSLLLTRVLQIFIGLRLSFNA